MRELLSCEFLPLAVCRELAAHLRQVTGVTVELLPQTNPHFDYRRSQVGALTIDYGPDFDAADQPLVQAILAHYGQRFGPCRLISRDTQ